MHYWARSLIVVFGFNLFLSACATQQGAGLAEGAHEFLDGGNRHVQLDVLSAQVVSSGWIEYKVALRNLSSQPLKSIRASIVGDDGVTYTAATSATDLSKSSLSVVGGDVAQSAAIGAAATTGLMLVPGAGLLMVAGQSLMMAEGRRLLEVQANFPSVSLTGRTIAVGDENIGSIFFPAVTPVSAKIGYLRNGKREWATIKSTGVPGEFADGPSQEAAPVNAEVQQVQTLLNELGYPCGTPDGVFGPKTKEAIERFQKDVGLPVDGVSSASLLLALQSEL